MHSWNFGEIMSYHSVPYATVPRLHSRGHQRTGLTIEFQNDGGFFKTLDCDNKTTYIVAHHIFSNPNKPLLIDWMMWFPLSHVVSTTLTVSRSLHDCRILPSDASWPNASEWNAFNNTLDGRLIRTVPLANACHQPSFNATQCQQVQANWHRAAFQYVFFSNVHEGLLKFS